MVYKFVIVFSFALVVALTNAVPEWEAEPSHYPSDAEWLKKHEHLLNQTRDHGKDVQVAFVGDSITEGWFWWGKPVWDASYANRHAYNYGIGGDRTQSVLWRIAHGEFDGLKPKLVVIMIGTNNIGGTSANIAKGIRAIVDAFRVKLPNSKLLLLSILPREPQINDKSVHEINKQVATYADHKMVYYLDLASHFEQGLGKVITELYTADHLHIDIKGYQLWHKLMEPLYLELTK